MRIPGACAVILFVGSMVASAQTATTYTRVLLNESFYFRDTTWRISNDPWVPTSIVTGATDTETMGDVGGGAAYLQFRGDAGTDPACQLYAFTRPDGYDTDTPLTMAEIDPSTAYLTFKYRLANPSAGEVLHLAMGLSGNDWGPQPANMVADNLGNPTGQCNGVFLYGHASFNQTDPGGYWGDGTMTLGPDWAQTMDPSTAVNYFWIHNVGWNANSETVLQIDQVVLHYNAPGPQNYPGDFNGDGKVTDADYTIWANYYSQPVPTLPIKYFDGNTDGIYTDADYTIWANNYGYGTGVVVPEPATMSLLGLGLFGLLRRRSA